MAIELTNSQIHQRTVKINKGNSPFFRKLLCMRHCQLSILFCLIAFVGLSQHYQPDKVVKRAFQEFEKGIESLQNGQFSQGIRLLRKSIQTDPKFVDAYLSLGGAYQEIRVYDSSVYFYEKALLQDPQYTAPYQLPYAISLAGQGNFLKALEYTNRFLSIPTLNEKSVRSGLYRKKTFEFALHHSAQVKDSTYKFLPINLGDSINSQYSEYYPALSVDDSLLVFTRRSSAIIEDFYASNRIGSNYGKAEKIAGRLNEEPRKGAISLSSDKNWMLFAGNFQTQSYGNFDIYVSYETDEGWSEPFNLGRNINTEFWETAPTLSPDKKTLYFVSNRPGGYGGSDLYVSYLQPNGNWSPAKNMGPIVNTAGDEQAPFIHVDNQTFYFTSDGHPGYGGSDLFMMRKQPNGEWGTPINLGYPINTIDNEGSMVVASNGVTAYYASDRSDSRGLLDLYKFELRKDIRPTRTLYVQGQVRDGKKGNGLPSAVELIDQENGQPYFTLQTDETGRYFTPLPIGKDYTFVVRRKGYLFFSKSYELSGIPADSTYQLDILLQPIQKAEKLILTDIRFKTGSAILENNGQVELNKLVQWMAENAEFTILIIGHTDNIGKPSDNLLLSKQRAKAVMDYLIEKGIPASRIQTSGKGDTEPLANNQTEEGRAQNRRTEILILD